MSPDTPLFGRLTVGNQKINLGRAGLSTLTLRLIGEIQKLRVGDDTVIQFEASRNKLMDSSSFDRAALIEQSIAANIITDDNAESPFPGITIGRVAAVMMTPEYEAYEAICEPAKRIGLNLTDLDEIRIAYHTIASDCFPYFPKWIP